MLNLSKRVEKAKKLVFSHNPYEPGIYGTWGSIDSKTYGTVYYNVTLGKTQGHIYTPDGRKKITILITDCQVLNGDTTTDQCPDCKYNKAVCKHSLGALYQSFKEIGKLISFYDSYESAVKMSFGHTVYKVANGLGTAWAVIKDWPKNKEEITLPTPPPLVLKKEVSDQIEIDCRRKQELSDDAPQWLKEKLANNISTSDTEESEISVSFPSVSLVYTSDDARVAEEIKRREEKYNYTTTLMRGSESDEGID